MNDQEGMKVALGDALATLETATKALALAVGAMADAQIALGVWESNDWRTAEQDLGAAKIDAEWQGWASGETTGKNDTERNLAMGHYLQAHAGYQDALLAYRAAQAERDRLQLEVLKSDAVVKAERVRWEGARSRVSALSSMVGGA